MISQSYTTAWNDCFFTPWSKRKLVQQYASILHFFNIFRRGVRQISRPLVQYNKLMKLSKVRGDEIFRLLQMNESRLSLGTFIY
jgi:hypothetical protein